jgi:hypothetical protein
MFAHQMSESACQCEEPHEPQNRARSSASIGAAPTQRPSAFERAQPGIFVPPHEQAVSLAFGLAGAALDGWPPRAQAPGAIAHTLRDLKYL